MYIRTSDGLGETATTEPGFLDFLKKTAEEAYAPSPLVTGDVFRKAVAGKAIASGAPLIEEGIRRAKAKSRPAIPREKMCWIQTVLNKTSGENLVPDGLYGPKTREAIRQFQRRSGLFADGIVGPRTNTALIQIVLNHISRASLLPVDGVMDARVQQEIKRFQRENNLATDGIVGSKTRVAMVFALGGRCGALVLSTKKPRENGLSPLTCNQPEYARLQKHCRDQAISYIVNCGSRFGLEGAKLIPIAIGIVAAAIGTAEVPPVSVIIALLGGAVVNVLGVAATYELATCIQAVLRGYKTCQSNAKEATRCL